MLKKIKCESKHCLKKMKIDMKQGGENNSDDVVLGGWCSVKHDLWVVCKWRSDHHFTASPTDYHNQKEGRVKGRIIHRRLFLVEITRKLLSESEHRPDDCACALDNIAQSKRSTADVYDGRRVISEEVLTFNWIIQSYFKDTFGDIYIAD